MKPPIRYMLDTDIASYGIQNRSDAIRLKLRHTSPSMICISSVTVAELLYGVKSISPNNLTAAAIQRFVRSAIVLDWNTAAAEAYADIRHSLTISGQLIGELDTMIAAHALSAGLILVTNNTRHFERLVPPLQLENWTQA